MELSETQGEFHEFGITTKTGQGNYLNGLVLYTLFPKNGPKWGFSAAQIFQDNETWQRLLGQNIHFVRSMKGGM